MQSHPKCEGSCSLRSRAEKKMRCRTKQLSTPADADYYYHNRRRTHPGLLPNIQTYFTWGAGERSRHVVPAVRHERNKIDEAPHGQPVRAGASPLPRAVDLEQAQRLRRHDHLRRPRPFKTLTVTRLLLSPYTHGLLPRAEVIAARGRLGKTAALCCMGAGYCRVLRGDTRYNQ